MFERNSLEFKSHLNLLLNTMPTSRVSIDLELAMSPFAMASIISGLRTGILKEVHVPANFRFIEVWNPEMQPRTLRLLEHSPGEMLDASRFFDYSPTIVQTDNPFAGLYLLARGWQEGLFKVLETNAMTERVANEFGDGFVFPDFYNRQSPDGRKFNLNPDAGGSTLEGLIGHSLENGIAPIFGDQEFLMHFSKQAEVLRMGRLVQAVPHDPNITRLKEIPASLTMESLYKLASDPAFAKLLPHVAVPTPANEGSGKVEIFAELGAVMIDHFSHSMYAGLGKVGYKIWRSRFTRD